MTAPFMFKSCPRSLYIFISKSFQSIPSFGRLSVLLKLTSLNLKLSKLILEMWKISLLFLVLSLYSFKLKILARFRMVSDFSPGSITRFILPFFTRALPIRIPFRYIRLLRLNVADRFSAEKSVSTDTVLELSWYGELSVIAILFKTMASNGLMLILSKVIFPSILLSKDFITLSARCVCTPGNWMTIINPKTRAIMAITIQADILMNLLIAIIDL